MVHIDCRERLRFAGVERQNVVQRSGVAAEVDAKERQQPHPDEHRLGRFLRAETAVNVEKHEVREFYPGM